MKRLFFVPVLFCLLVSLVSCGSKESRISINGLGSPYADSPVNSRITWDMIYLDGYLYIGAGDYGDNICPDTFYRLCVESGIWEACGTIADEQISRFLLFDGVLAAPGIDPVDAWEHGNYYLLENGEMTLHRTIPDAIHTFDLALLNGLLFTGDGVKTGTYPVSLSRDGGDTFTRPLFLKDGEQIDISMSDIVRVYDFATVSGELYAFLWLDRSVTVYRFDGEDFVFTSDWTGKFSVNSSLYTVPILSKVSVDKEFYFTSGQLYVSEGMEPPVLLPPEDADQITDLLTVGDVLYALGYSVLPNGAYRMRIYRCCDRELTSLYTFDYPVPAVSFTYADDTIWFGFGSQGISHENVGTVISASVRLPE